MTDVRRVALNSVSPTEKEKKVKKKPVTLRFVLTLGESNSSSCPEYSFTDLVKSEKGKHPLAVNENPFDDRNEDSEVARIAQQFEAKYGAKSFKAGRKKRTQDMDDYFDLGEGYDTEDSFIDNTEAYDEVIPSTLTTMHGGFYINQGKLDFRSFSDDSNEGFQRQEQKKKKKQIIESESEEETGQALHKKYKAMKRKKLLERKEGEKKKKIMPGVNGELVKKRKKKSLDLQRAKKAMTVKTSETKTVTPSTESVNSSVTVTVTSTTLTSVVSSSNNVVSTGVASTTTAAIAVISVTAPTTATSISSKPEASSISPNQEILRNSYASILEEAMKDESSSKSGDEEKKESLLEEKITQLPSQLPPELLEAIELIKKEAKETKEGKSKFFSADINKLLLNIEMGSLKLGKSQRSAIFSHLSEHMPSGKHTLLRRAKKLREEEDLLKGPVAKLKAAISKVMPALEEQHEKDVARLKLENQTGLSEAAKEEASTESEEEEGKSDVKKIVRRRARRKFEWTPEIRELYLCIVQSKMKKFDASKSKNLQPEEYLKSFLENEIKPIWPAGWMNTRLLYKVARTAQDENAKGTKPKKSSAGKVSPVFESPQHQHVSRKEDVIEISSILDDDIEEKKNVVVNLFDKNPSSPIQFSTQSVSLLGTSPTISSMLPQARTNPTASSQASVSHSLSVKDVTPNSGAFATKSSDKGTSKRGSPSNSTWRVNSPDVLIIDSESPKKPGTFQSNSASSSLLQGVSPKAVSSNISPQSLSTPKSTGGLNPTSSFSTSTPNSSQSFLQAFNQYINQTQSQKEETGLNKGGTVTSPSQQGKSIGINSGLQQAEKKASQHQQSLHDPLSQSKTQGMTSSPLAKTSQEYKTTNLPQKGISSTNGRDSLLKSPVVTINRIPISGPKSGQKQSISYAGKGPSSQVPSTLISSTQPRPQAQTQNFVPQHSLSLKKKNQPPVNSSQPLSISLTLSSSSNKVSKSVPVLSPVSMSSSNKQVISSTKHFPSQISQLPGTSPTNNSAAAAQRKTTSTAQPTSQLKSGIVLGTSVPKIGQQPHQQLSRQHLQQQQQRSQLKSGAVLSSSSSPLTVRTSPISSTTVAANKSISPSNSLIQSTSLLSASRTSTPSPQKSPVSPSNAASLYDRIQSQIRHQEATEEQGLKALAMALNFGGIPASNPKHLAGQGNGNGSAQTGHSIPASSQLPVQHTMEQPESCLSSGTLSHLGIELGNR